MELLGISEDLLDFENESSGFLGLVSRKPVTVRVSAKGDVPDETIIKGVAITLIQKMGIEVEPVDFIDAEENYVLHLESDDSGILIGRQGRTLDAIQFLLNLLLNSELKKKKRVLLDVAEYRERR